MLSLEASRNKYSTGAAGVPNHVSAGKKERRTNKRKKKQQHSEF